MCVHQVAYNCKYLGPEQNVRGEADILSQVRPSQTPELALTLPKSWTWEVGAWSDL